MATFCLPICDSAPIGCVNLPIQKNIDSCLISSCLHEADWEIDPIENSSGLKNQVNPADVYIELKNKINLRMHSYHDGVIGVYDYCPCAFMLEMNAFVFDDEKEKGREKISSKVSMEKNEPKSQTTMVGETWENRPVVENMVEGSWGRMYIFLE